MWTMREYLQTFYLNINKV